MKNKAVLFGFYRSAVAPNLLLLSRMPGEPPKNTPSGLSKIKALLKKITGTDEKDLSTLAHSPPSWHQSYLRRVIDDRVAKDSRSAHTGDSLNIQALQANVFSITTWGGPGSKYKDINEDSFFSGVSRGGNLIAGVIDGAGGSNHGYLGGKYANQALSEALMHDFSLKQAFALADKEVALRARGGYATGVSIVVEQDFKVRLAAKGDAKALTVRHGKILPQGTTRMQSKVAYDIEQGLLPAYAIHNGRNKHIVYSVIGNSKKPLYETAFQGEVTDQIILGTDGLWDVVAEYEVLKLTQKLRGKHLQQEIYDLAYARNNSTTPFEIEFQKNEFIELKPLYVKGKQHSGDNITVLVVELADNVPQHRDHPLAGTSP